MIAIGVLRKLRSPTVVHVVIALLLLTLFGHAQQTDSQASAQDQPCDKPQQPETKKEKRGSLIAAPIPISSPAIGSGAIIAGGYIFPLRRSDTVSQPSTIGGAIILTDNGTRAWALAGEFYVKQDTYHITTVYLRGNINYDFFGTGTKSGDAGHTLPMKQTGELFLGDFLYRLRWKISIGPRFLSGNSNITLRSENESEVTPPRTLDLKPG